MSIVPAPHSSGGSENLSAVIQALELIADVLPAGHEVFTVVSDSRGAPTDLIVTDRWGDTSIVLGLAEVQHDQLSALLAVLRRTTTDAGHAGADPTRAAIEPTVRRATHPTVGEATFRSIVDGSPVPLVVIGRGGIIEYASATVVPVLGMVGPTEMNGMPFTRFLHPDDRERLGSLSDLSRARMANTAFTVRLIRADGSFAAANVTPRTLPDRDGLVVAVQPASTSDLGFRELLITERRQRALANAADCGTALLDIDTMAFGMVIDCNETFARIIDRSSGEISGHAVWELFADPDAERVREALRHTADGRGSDTVRARLPQRTPRHVELTVTIDRALADPPRQLTLRIRDITEQHGIVEELHRTVDRLTRENRGLAKRVEGTAHHLTAPLRTVSGWGEIMRRWTRG